MARWMGWFVLLAPGVASAGTLSPWGAHTSVGETWLTPYLLVEPGAVSNNTYVAIGTGDRFDLIGGVGLGYADTFEAGVVEVMPRYFVSDQVGVVLRVGSVPGMPQLEVGPELHAAWGAGPLAFTTNLGWRPVVGEGSAAGSAFAVFAPELFVTEALSLFTEVNPGVDLGAGDVDVTLVPGFGFAKGDQGFAIGTQIPLADPGAWSVGAWYSVRLGAVAGR